MAVVGVDLGGTKLALAVFSEEGALTHREAAPLDGRSGAEVGALIVERARRLVERCRTGRQAVRAVGVAVPGIYHADQGTVWAPNLGGWEAYPLLAELRRAFGEEARVAVDSDRACSILGETWQGTARGSRNAIFIAVGTGIGAGIMIDGRVLRGHRDIAGAAGWMALHRPFRPGYAACGCFEYQASGPGLVRVARELLAAAAGDGGILAAGDPSTLTTADVFRAYEGGNALAGRVIDNAVELWGMAVANLVSVFDPEIVVFGGGVFGPAATLLGRIREEALRWAQPISMPQVRLGVTSLGGDACLYGAGHLALRTLRAHS